MFVPILLFILGLLLLIKGGDWFVDGATGIAHKFHIPELIIGATVVSIGTTLPEVMVSATSAMGGHGELAYGNAVGSIICNTALIAAITVAIKPGKVDGKALRLPVLFFFLSAAVYVLNVYLVGYFHRWIGIVLLGIFAVYLTLSIMQGRKMPPKPEDHQPDAPQAPEMSIGRYAILLAVGAALIAVGAKLLQ